MVDNPWIIIGYVLIFIVAGFYFGAFRCPRCRKRFLSGEGFIFFKNKCGGRWGQMGGFSIKMVPGNQ
jgi:hypothetical protein